MRFEHTDNIGRERCLCQLRSAIPEAVACAEGRAGEFSLSAYSESFASGGIQDGTARRQRAEAQPLQDGGDIIALAEAKAASLFSPQTGKAVCRELENRFAALTANHHGMDFHAEFLQGNFIFALASRYAVPVFSWGGVPCSNAAFTRGVLFAPRSADTAAMYRFSLLPNTYRRVFVSAGKPYEKTCINAGLRAAEKSLLTEKERQVLKAVLSEIYLDARVLARPALHEQMSVANYLLWQKLFSPKMQMPPLVCLELQQLARELLIKDLRDPYSLCSLILTEPFLTAAVFAGLNGARGCWTHTREGMERGTFLFWAVDERKYGNRLIYDPQEHSLHNQDNPGQRFSLNAEAICSALREGKILPSLYLSYMLLSAVRGLACAGGVFQCAYLPFMAKKTAEALRHCGENALADRLGVLSPFCTGALPLRTRFPFDTDGKDANCGAGAMEILQAGGITPDIWVKLGSVPLKEAFYCAADYQYEDLIPEQERAENWQELLACRSGIFLPQGV